MVLLTIVDQSVGAVSGAVDAPSIPVTKLAPAAAGIASAPRDTAAKVAKRVMLNFLLTKSERITLKKGLGRKGLVFRVSENP